MPSLFFPSCSLIFVLGYGCGKTIDADDNRSWWRSLSSAPERNVSEKENNKHPTSHSKRHISSRKSKVFLNKTLHIRIVLDSDLALHHMALALIWFWHMLHWIRFTILEINNNSMRCSMDLDLRLRLVMALALALDEDLVSMRILFIESKAMNTSQTNTCKSRDYQAEKQS